MNLTHNFIKFWPMNCTEKIFSKKGFAKSPFAGKVKTFLWLLDLLIRLTRVLFDSYNSSSNSDRWTAMNKSEQQWFRKTTFRRTSKTFLWFFCLLIRLTWVLVTFLFPKLKNRLKWRHFGKLENIQTALDDPLKTIQVSALPCVVSKVILRETVLNCNYIWTKKLKKLVSLLNLHTLYMLRKMSLLIMSEYIYEQYCLYIF